MPFDILKYDSCLSNIMINGNKLDNDFMEDRLFEWIDDFFTLRRCPYCKNLLKIASKEEVDENLPSPTAHAHVGECISCGFWQAYYFEEMGTGPYGCPCAEWEAHLSKLSEFPTTLPEGCNQELAQYLKVNPSFWNSINPIKLERLVADIFRANYTTSEVFHVGKSNDGGVDVVYIDSGKNRWLVQVKRREKADKSEGVSTLRNLLGAMLLKNSKYGMVVSTSDHFSYWAQKATEEALCLGYTIELIDKGKLKRLIEPLLPSNSWIKLIKEKRPEWVNELGIGMPNRRQMKIIDYIGIPNMPLAMTR